MVQNIFWAKYCCEAKRFPHVCWNPHLSPEKYWTVSFTTYMYPIRFEDRYRWTNGPVWRCEEFTVRLVYSDTSVVLLFGCIMIQFHLPMKRLLFGSLLDFDRNYVRNDSSIVNRCHKVRHKNENQPVKAFIGDFFLMVRLHRMFWKEVLKRQRATLTCLACQRELILHIFALSGIYISLSSISSQERSLLSQALSCIIYPSVMTREN